ncbi:hypothetical protein NE237_000014 [Protea cynaroides]|uniref:Uncharacterized protein n=1 Tax=Protea cynaroides TaxID=273540 RepID=A0A9Q0GP92_9MAGN|nr:hypothetical protein NE237_000014 [Protea cynaroides]
MKTHQATFGNEKDVPGSVGINPVGIGGSSVLSNDGQAKVLVEDGNHINGKEDQNLREEEWTHVRVKKKRSGGSPAGYYPTHHPRSHPLQQSGQVSPSGKTPLLTSKIDFPPNLPCFRSGDGVLNSGLCNVSAGPGIFHFGVLAAEEGQSNLAGLQSPLVPLPPDRSRPDSNTLFRSWNGWIRIWFKILSIFGW